MRSGGQHGYADAFDKFAPAGTILCSPSQIPEPTKFTLRTLVNGEQRDYENQQSDFQNSGCCCAFE
jgi:2-keto-4-pentenoate hydratase/2-oxohepta-3-ene-1,7-dioic acid hydratase in catechol pathway